MDFPGLGQETKSCPKRYLKNSKKLDFILIYVYTNKKKKRGKKMKRVLISILSLIFIVSMITTVYAATGSVSLNASADSVIKGKTFTVTVVANGDNNVTGISSTLSYDTTKLSLENKKTSNGFTDVPSGNELNAGILSTEGITLSKSVTIYTLTFKALDTASEGETEISLTNVELGLVNESSVQEDVIAGNASVKINIKEDDTTAGNQGGTQEPEDNDGKTGNPSNNAGNTDGDNGGNNPNTGKEDKKEEPKKDKVTKLPQTGAESASIIAIIALGAISIASYISYRKYKNI